ncbi:MAG: TolC family protein [Planctomycetes bacterium]|nr:TolC family protein [Planctomycetota bacterium]
MALLVAAAGCKSPTAHREDADRRAARIIEEKQIEALGHAEPFTIEKPSDTFRRRLIVEQGLLVAGPESLGTDQLAEIKHWPEKNYPAATPPVDIGKPGENPEPVKIGLLDALQIAARNSREYQAQKEQLFEEALDLDLEKENFKGILNGSLDSTVESNHAAGDTETGVDSTGGISWSRLLENGVSIGAALTLDLAKMLTGDRESSFGILADASISIPLMRGAGRHVAAWPLEQAQRDVVYAVYSFERFKRVFAVNIASDYLAVLQQYDELQNAEDNYKRLITSARRARRMADAGRLPEIQVNQTVQDELRARGRWISARERCRNRLDNFKIEIGLPADADVELDRDALEKIGKTLQEAVETAPDAADAVPPGGEESAAESLPADAPVVLKEPTREGGGPLEMDTREATQLALENRLDLRTARDEVYDAQRKVVVAAEALKAGFDVVGGLSAGERRSISSADEPNAQLRFERGSYSAGFLADLPWDRDAERNAYRKSFIALERSVRAVQELEDQIKLDVRSALRNLLSSRETIRIQATAVRLAERRVLSTELFLQAGRAEIRDVLEAQEAFVSAQNQLTAALVDYRVAQLELQRDMGLLKVDQGGLWREYKGDEEG